MCFFGSFLFGYCLNIIGSILSEIRLENKILKYLLIIKMFKIINKFNNYFKNFKVNKFLKLEVFY